MTRSVSLVALSVAILGGAACAPSANDTSPSGTLVAGRGGGGGAGPGTGTGSGGSGDVSSSGGSGSSAGRGGGNGGNTGTGTGTAGADAAGAAGGAAGAAGSVAPAADPIQAADDGVTAYQGGDYEGAIMNLMASLAADPDGPAAATATFFIARSQQQLDDCATAVAGYQMFLESYPDDDFADDAQFRIGECACIGGDYATGLVELQKVLDDYADSDAANDAQYTIGLCYLEQASAAAAGPDQDALLTQARDACQAAIDDYPDRADGTTSPWAQVCIGLTYEVVGDCAEELAAMQQVISDYTVDPNTPCTTTADHVGSCGQRQGAIDEANQHITDLEATTPVDHTCL